MENFWLLLRNIFMDSPTLAMQSTTLSYSLSSLCCSIIIPISLFFSLSITTIYSFLPPSIRIRSFCFDRLTIARHSNSLQRLVIFTYTINILNWLSLNHPSQRGLSISLYCTEPTDQLKYKTSFFYCVSCFAIRTLKTLLSWDKRPFFFRRKVRPEREREFESGPEHFNSRLFWKRN